MKWLHCILIALIGMSVSVAAYAQDAEVKEMEQQAEPAQPAEAAPAEEPAAEGDETMSSEMPSDLPPPELTLGMRLGDGEVESYGDVLVPVYLLKDGLWFVNPRFSRNDHEEEELNVGIGYRYLVPNRNMILGANAYYDYRNTEHGSEFHQLGLGLEYLSENVDARINYYKPEDKRVTIDEWTETDVQSSSSSWTEWDNPYGQGNSIVQEGVTYTRKTTTTTTYFFEQYEQAMEGLDCELGFRIPIPVISEYADVKVFGGYYSYNKRFGGEDIKGAKGRLEIRAVPAVYLDAEVYENDELYGTDYFVGARVNVPLDLKGGSPFGNFEDFMIKRRDIPFASRLGEMVMRDLHVITEVSEQTEIEEKRETVKESQTDEKNLDEQLATDITFVHGDKGDDANPGTAEEPKKTVSAGVSNGTTKVFAYNFSTSYNENVVIEEDKWLMGEGHPIGFGGLAVGGGTHPTINGGGAGMPPAIYIDGNAGANNVAVMGFRLINQGSIGDEAVYINNVANAVLAYNIIEHAEIGVHGDYDGGGAYNLLMHHNRIRNLGYGTDIDVDDSSLNFVLQDNIIEGNGIGIYADVEGTAGTMRFLAQNNLFRGNSGNAEAVNDFIDDMFGPGYTPLPADTPQGAGIIIGAFDGASLTGTVQNSVFNETLVGAAGFAYGSNAYANLTFQNNVLNGGGSATIFNYLMATGAIPPILPPVIDLSLAGLGAAGMYSGSVDVVIQDNVIVNHVLGIGVGGYEYGTVNADINNNNLQHNLAGILGVSLFNSELNIDIQNNHVKGGGIAPLFDLLGIPDYDYGVGNITLVAATESKMNNVTIQNNILRESLWGAGIIAIDRSEVTNAMVTGNEIYGNLFGVLAGGGGENNEIRDLLIADNTIDGGGFDPITEALGMPGLEVGLGGVLLVAVDETQIINPTIRDNTIVDNLIGVGAVAYGEEGSTDIGFVDIENNRLADNMIGVVGAAAGPTTTVHIGVYDNVIDGGGLAQFEPLLEMFMGPLSPGVSVPDLGVGGVLLVGMDGGTIMVPDVIGNTINDHMIGVGMLALNTGLITPQGGTITAPWVLGNTMNDNWLGVLGVAYGEDSIITSPWVGGNVIDGSGLGQAVPLITDIIGFGPPPVAIPDYGIGGVLFAAVDEASITSPLIADNTISDHLLGVGLIAADDSTINNGVVAVNTIDDSLIGILGLSLGDGDAETTMNNLGIYENTVNGAGLDTIGDLLGENLPAMGAAGILVVGYNDAQADNLDIVENNVNDFALGITVAGLNDAQMNDTEIISNNVDNALAGIALISLEATNNNAVISHNTLNDSMLGVTVVASVNGAHVENAWIGNNTLNNSLIGFTVYGDDGADMSGMNIVDNTVDGGVSAQQLAALDTITGGLGLDLTDVLGAVGTNLLANLPAGQGMSGVLIYHDEGGDMSSMVISNNTFTSFPTMGLIMSDHSAAPVLDLSIVNNVNDMNPLLPAVTGMGNDFANVTVTNNAAADGILIIP